MRRAAIPILLAFPVALGATTAGAQTLDLYQNTVIGSPRIVGMGGTVAAAADDMTGTLATPAAMAFRPPGAVGSWDWDFYLDTLVASRDTDLANSGLPASPDRAIQAYAGGICLYLGKWGVAISGAGVSYGLPPAASGTAPTTLMADGSQLAVGRSVLDGQLGIGASLAIAEFAIKSGDTTLFDLTGGTLATGVLVRPTGLPWRAGLSARLPAATTDVTNNCPDPNDCNGFVPPMRGQSPWQISAGVAWRFGQMTWNEPNPGLFRDERALVLAADVAVVGPVTDGLASPGSRRRWSNRRGERRRRRRDWARRPSSCLDGCACASAPTGSPGRIEDRDGRLHGTTGAELRLFRFSFREKERRVRLALAADIAQRYQNIALSIGFWH